MKDKCVPHYFFGERKNLLNGDIVENTEQEKSLLETKTTIMLDGIKRMKDTKYLVHKVILFCSINFMDFQWPLIHSGYSLYSSALVTSFFDGLLQAIQDGSENLTPYVIKHREVMMQLIEFAPRKYGCISVSV